jgi:protoheme IX farnesyltransferase
MLRGDENCLEAAPVMTSSGETGVALALLRLAKPGIVIAEVMAGLAGMLLASSGPPATPNICLVLFAIALAAGGAAMLNNILDAAADRQMTRLASRSRALETVGPGRVLVIALLLMGGGIVLAALKATPVVPLLLAGGCCSYLLLYTAWLKRRSPWGVMAGCIPGALPPLIGAAAISGTVAAVPLMFAVIVFIWQLPHFWLLALDCRNQYHRAGIPVLPLTHGEQSTKALVVATALLLLPAGLVLGLLGSLSSVYLSVATFAGITFPLYCWRCVYHTHNYRHGFIVSLVYLLAIIFAVCVESLI